MREKKRRSREPPAAQNLGFGSIGADFEAVFGNTISGMVVNERTALEMVPVMAAARIISDTIASLPLHVYERADDGGKRRAYNHPLYTLLHDSPNPDMTSFEFRRAMMGNVLVYGNAYAEIIRNGLMEVVQINPLNSSPEHMKKDRRNGEIVYIYTDDLGRERTPYRRHEILHIHDFGLDGLLGMSRVSMAKNAIGLALAAQQHGADYLKNGAAPGGAILSPGLIANQREFQRKWDEKYKGPGKRGKIAFLEEGLKYQQIGSNPDQAQLTETREFQIQEIARIFNVPPHMIGDLKRATFSNIEHQAIEFAKHSISPWLTNWEQAALLSLFPASDRRRYFVEFNMDGLLRGDYESRMKGHAIALGNAILSVNEVRSVENRNPIGPSGDIHIVNGNVCKLEDAGAAYKKGGA